LPRTPEDKVSSAELLDQLADRSAWVKAAIIATLIGSIVTLCVMALEGGAKAIATAREPLLILAALVAAWFVQRGRARAGALVLLISIWLEIHVTLVEGGARAPVGPIFPLVVIGAALFVGARFAILAALSALLTIPLALLLRQQMGLGAALPNGDALTVVLILLGNMTGALILALFLRSFAKVLRSSENNARRARALIDGAPDAILSVDPNGLVQDCNPAAERLFGKLRDKLVGRSFASLGLVEVSSVPQVNGRVSVDTLTGDPRQYTLDAETVVEGLLRMVPGPEGNRGALIVLRNITGRKLAERRAAELQQQLQHTQKLDAVGQLAGGVAHDINNLLTTVGGYGDLLANHDDPLIRQVAEELGIARDRGSSLTRQLLAFARKESAQPRGMDLAESLNGMRRLLERLAGEQITLTLDTARGCVIYADPGQIEQVVLNLAMNARDAMPEGGSLVISCYLDQQVERVELRVSDTGVGMTEATRQRAFEPFFTTKARGQGTGLGLSTVHGIVEASGGKIQLNSTPDQGTNFVLSWPSYGVVDEQERASVTSVPTDAFRGRVLMVEDDVQSRKVLRRLLDGAGFRVEVASNADEAFTAFDRLSRLGESPELLLTDVRMPGKTGPELADELRRDHPDLQVLFISGYLGQTLEGTQFDPIADLLRKPFSAEALIKRVNTKIRASRRGWDPAQQHRAAP
jgi:PAS domain S-box-containing protein